MGVDSLIDFEIIRISLEEGKIDVKSSRKTFKSILKQPDLTEIPLSWVFLRSLLTGHRKFYITYSDLLKKAKECNIHHESLDDFCDYFTSYGSIFDIRKIEKASEYIIVKPFDFFSHLVALFQAEKQGNGIMSINNKDNDVVMQIMSCVGLGLSLPYPSGITSPNTYYFPSVQSSKVKMSCTPQAVQLVLSTKSPRINMQIDVTKQLLRDMQKSSLSLDPIEYVNSITITTEGEILAGIELTFQGDVTEITLKNIERIPDNQLEHLCLTIVKALQAMFKEKAELLDGIRYHYAVRCKQDKLGQAVAFKAYRKRHLLPNHTLCDDCKRDYIDRQVIKAWNSALEKVRIGL